MRRLTWYVLRQVAVSTLVVAATLTLAIWLTQSLRFVDWIVNRGLPLSTFGYIALLTMPMFLNIILPIAAFSAVLFTYNKLQADSELIVLRAVGLGPTQLMTPAWILIVACTLLGYALTLWVLPTCYRNFKDLQFEIRSAYASVLVQEGVFTDIEDHVSIFVRAEGPGGELQGILVHDTHDPQRPVTLVADSGRIVQGPEGPRIMMVNGNRQELDRRTGHVSFLFFERYTYAQDTAASGPAAERQRDANERYLSELFDPPDSVDARTLALYRSEAHQRLVVPLMSAAFVMVALAAILVGSYNRRGMTRRILAAVLIVMAIQALGIGLGNLAGKSGALIPLLYLNALAPIIGGAVLIQIDRLGTAWRLRPSALALPGGP